MNGNLISSVSFDDKMKSSRTEETTIDRSVSTDTMISSSRSVSSDTKKDSGRIDFKISGLPPGWIKLNVGGKVFQTHRQTLLREENSFLARLCQEPECLPSDRDEDGAFLIDRDPDYFSSVLNYLRHGKLILSNGLREEGLLEEAEFYNMPGLIHLCNEKMLERTKPKNNIQHVYRVLQCHGDELTHMVSHLSDGWKFKQLIPIGLETIQQNGEFAQEYVCVVTREYVESENAHQNYEGSDRAQFLQQKAMHN